MITVQIYEDTRTNKKYALEEQLTMGTKICLKPFDKTEDKFVSPSTLKRWYRKYKEVNRVVEIKAFTGMKIGMFEILHENDTTIDVLAKNGSILTFSRETEKQINAKNPKFANHISYTMGLPYIPSSIRA